MEEEEARRRDARWVTLLESSEWEAEFDVHIACALEESGYPRRIEIYGEALPAPVRKLGAPSFAVLSAPQKKARDRILSYSASTLKTTSHSDLVMKARFRDPHAQTNVDYRMVIRLDDAKFPANAAHFCVAASTYALGNLVHQCFVPPGRTAATMPFVTLYHHDSKVLCNQKPVMLPDADIVYGEYTAPDDEEGLIYPVGSVLVYPRCMIPSRSTRCSHDTPVFIVFKPCVASLLRGAVPVGRVMSCVRGTTATKADNSSVPFDDAVLRCFEHYCGSGECDKDASTYSYCDFDKFMGRIK